MHPESCTSQPSWTAGAECFSRSCIKIFQICPSWTLSDNLCSSSRAPLTLPATCCLQLNVMGPCARSGPKSSFSTVGTPTKTIQNSSSQCSQAPQMPTPTLRLTWTNVQHTKTHTHHHTVSIKLRQQLYIITRKHKRTVWFCCTMLHGVAPKIPKSS